LNSVSSPYAGLDEANWKKRTQELSTVHPLKTKELKEIVLNSWNSILKTSIGSGFKIGVDIFPKPQIMAFLLHELIALEMKNKHKGKWRGDETGSEKDLVCLTDEKYSIEIKASSNPTRIFGNRSYSQKTDSGSKKGKSGYYLAINFEKFQGKDPQKPKILLIRFGWIDHTDWIGQAAATGQQSRLPPAVENFKLLSIYSAN